MRSARSIVSIICHSREGGNPENFYFDIGNTANEFVTMMRYTYYVYIIASKRNGTLYIGATNNLLRRVFEYKKKIIEGFTSKYNVDKLVYFEQTDSIHSAIAREKQLKKYNRSWKLRMIEKFNPGWNDLYYEFGGTDNLFDVKMILDSRLRGNDRIMDN